MSTLEFELPDMTCGHCVAAVTKAVKQLDGAADVKTDLASHRVVIGSAVDRDTLAAALSEAGYPPR